MADKTISAARLRGLLAKQLQVLESLGDVEVPASAHNGAMASYQHVLAVARSAGAAPQGPAAEQGAEAGHGPGTGNPGAGAGGHVRGQVDLSAEMSANAQRAARVRAEQEAEDRALFGQLAQSRLERAQKLAAEQFPAAVPLLDMVEFDPNDLEGYLASVAQLSEAMGGPGDGPASVPEAPPVGASNAPLAAPDSNDVRAQARERARETGDWSSYFRTAEAMARGETPPAVE